MDRTSADGQSGGGHAGDLLSDGAQVHPVPVADT